MADVASPVETVADVVKEPKRRWGRMALMFSVPLLILAVGAFYWASLQGKVSTDNAYIQQDKVSVSAEIGGRLVEVMVAENEEVTAGQLLFRIDPEPYRLQIAESDAAIAGAQSLIRN